jgi:uncharacterized protein YutE (UPF0331/DUF86 family)
LIASLTALHRHSGGCGCFARLAQVHARSFSLSKRFTKQLLKELEGAVRELESCREETFSQLAQSRRERWALRYGVLETIQIVIDVACAVVSHENLGHPKSYAECLRILGERGRIEKPLAERLARAVGLRNVLVHEYLDVNDRLVFEALDDLRAFATQIAHADGEDE